MVEILSMCIVVAMIGVVGYGMVTGGISSLRKPSE
jgi:hypothetical protein